MVKASIPEHHDICHSLAGEYPCEAFGKALWLIAEMQRCPKPRRPVKTVARTKTQPQYARTKIAAGEGGLTKER